MSTKRKRIVILIVSLTLAFAVITTFVLLGFLYFPYTTKGSDYGIIQIDLSVKPAGLPSKYDYLYHLTVVDACDGGENYLAHPDSVLLNKGTDREAIFTSYVQGHGRGALLTKLSYDGGISYSERIETTPASWQRSEETPTVYELDFVNGNKRLIMISANPKWPGYTSGDGFNVSVSDDGGASWTEFEKFYGKDSDFKVNAIVAMSSLTRLKENGEFVDKWMGLFHDNTFRCYKTVLTFSDDGKMCWSKPVELFENCVDEKGKKTDCTFFAKMAQLCEIEAVRSDGGNGDQIMLLARCNTKRMNSVMTYSCDEGETWAKPKELPSSINGERHKAEYLQDGRLFVTFRSIERDKEKKKSVGCGAKKFFSEGWVAWIGTYDDLMNWYNGDGSAQGQYRIKLAHTFLDGQTAPQLSANSDTGYAGVVVLKDGTVVTASYGRFGQGEKTYIASKRLRMEDVDELYDFLT